MKPEDLKEFIQFHKLRFEHKKITSITARLTLDAHATMSDELVQAVPDIEDKIKRELIERITRRLYDDQRDLLMKAVMDFMACNPLSYQELHDARANLLFAASRQEPNLREEISYDKD